MVNIPKAAITVALTALINLNLAHAQTPDAQAIYSKTPELVKIFVWTKINPGPQNPTEKTKNGFQTRLIFDAKSPEPVKLPEQPKIAFKIEPSVYQKELERELALAEAEKQKKSARVSYAFSPTPEPDFESKRQLVQNIASRYGIDWKILLAVWQVESGQSWDRYVVSRAGAIGPMQFLPSTFRKYAQDNDGDGQPQICNAADSLASAANLLANSGAADGNIDQAIFNYNHSMAYVNKVKNIASSI